MVDIKAILETAIENRASDVHINVGMPPVLRRDTELIATEFPPVTNQDARGMVLAMVGLDPIESVPRFTLEGILGQDNSLFLWDGVSLIAVTIGLFAIPEIIDLAGRLPRVPHGSATVSFG